MSAFEVFHWVPDKERWDSISWANWMAFRAIMTPFAPLPGVSGGIHYFVVCVQDGDVPLNLIPHKYLIDPDGRIGDDNFGGLTKQERDDYNRLMMASKEEPGNRERLNEIRGKMGRVYYPPKSSIPALMSALPKPPKYDSAADKFIKSFDEYLKVVR